MNFSPYDALLGAEYLRDIQRRVDDRTAQEKAELERQRIIMENAERQRQNTGNYERSRNEVGRK